MSDFPLPEWAPSRPFFDEWLETNGIGGFACGTVSGALTRRYHAFLCAATRAPQERRVLVSKIEEFLLVDGQSFALSANFWPDSISPRGDRFLESFALAPLPRWIFRVPTEHGDVVLEKTLVMPHGHNATLARFRQLEGPHCELQIRPFVVGRDYHSTHLANAGFGTKTWEDDGRIAMRAYEELPEIFFSGGRFEADGYWYCNFVWPIERERGLDWCEDAFSPGVWSFDLSETAYFAASTDKFAVEETVFERETARRRELGGSDEWNEPENRLKRAADQFIVRREDGLHTILAGYPWFTDWGRDTMIALPGLCLSTERFDLASSILRAFAGAMSQGMIPNRFPEAGEAVDTNTVDATLWFFHAVAEYGRASGDWETVGELYPKLRESVEWHLGGTRFGIKADPDDGLLRAGDEKTQLTWMDAKVGDVAFTPRAGKPVEIQALWYHALLEMASLARRFNDDDFPAICTEWARKVGANFPRIFWNESENCLFDVVDGDFRDGAIRPNQIFALSLPHRMLSHEQELGVLSVVERDLLTPRGLRSLSPRDSRFRAIYEGGQWERDSAYHQGTVWSWPLGAFLSAYLRVHDRSDAAREQVNSWIQPMISHLDEAGIGQISEIFDGNAPHHPRGCFAQAWGTSEVLRVWKELNS